MGINNLQSVFKRLAITLAFSLGAVLVTLGLWLLQPQGDSGAGMFTAGDWLRLGSVAVAYAFLSGLVVDMIRLLFDLGFGKAGSVRLRNIDTLDGPAVRS